MYTYEIFLSKFPKSGDYEKQDVKKYSYLLEANGEKASIAYYMCLLIDNGFSGVEQSLLVF